MDQPRTLGEIFDECKDPARSLSGLLDHQYPGIASWMLAVGDAMEKVARLYLESRGIDADKLLGLR